jgi:hypothetical protein
MEDKLDECVLPDDKNFTDLRLNLNGINSTDNLQANNNVPLDSSNKTRLYSVIGFKNRKDPEESPEPIWDKKKTWETRKKEAIAKLENQDNAYSKAYKGTYEEFKQALILACKFDEELTEEKKIEILDDFINSSQPTQTDFEKESRFKFERNEYSLTPLVFALWGLMDDENNRDRESCLELLLKIIKTDIDKHISLLGSEAGHLYIHYFDRCEAVLGPDKLLELIIKRDYIISLEYIIKNRLPVLNVLTETIGNYNIFMLAVTSESLESANLLFTYINNLDPESFRIFIRHIEPEFYKIFMSKSSLLKPFLDKLMEFDSIKVSVNQKHLPLMVFTNVIDTNKIKNKTSEPNTADNSASDTKKSPIVKDDIYQYGIPKDKESKPDTVEVCNSLIRLPSVNGSYSSYKLMYNLTLKSSIEVFKSDLIKYYIKNKWNSLWTMIFLQSLLLWTTLLLLALWISNKESLYVILLIIIHFIQVITELCQMYSLSIRGYFGGIELYPFIYLGFWCICIYHYFFSSSQLITFIFCCFIYFMIQCKNYKKRLYKLKSEYMFFICLLGTILFYWIKIEGLFIAFFLVQGILMGASLYIEKGSPFGIYLLINFIHFQIFFLIDAWGSNTKDLVLVSQITSQLMMFPVILFIILFRAKTPILIKIFMILFISTPFALALSYYFIDDNSALDFFFYFFFAIYLVFEQLILKLTLERNISEVKYGVPHMILIFFAMNFYKDRQMLYYVIVYLILEAVSKFFKTRKFFHKLRDNVIRFLFNLNTLDATRLIVFFTWVGVWYNNTPSRKLTWFLALISFIRGLTAFRCFDGTRYYSRLVFNSIINIRSFLVIVFYSTVGFGFIRRIYNLDSGDESLNFGDFIVSALNEDLQTPDPVTGFEFEYIIYLVAGTINIIVILNLLISVLGKSFEEFNLTRNENDYREMAESIFEIESIMFYRRNKHAKKPNNLGYLLIWDHWKDNKNTDEEGKETAKNPEIEALEKSVASLHEKLEKVLSYIQEKT